MGLDMYLNRVPKVSSVSELTVVNERLNNAYKWGGLQKAVKEIKEEKRYIYDIDCSFSPYSDTLETEIRVAYWRKFNALHRWFVENVQNGQDDCEVYIVTDEHLKSLKETLEKITQENANDLFPIGSGFFFGSSEYDEDYFQDIEELKSTVNHLINQKLSDITYTYQSSW